MILTFAARISVKKGRGIAMMTQNVMDPWNAAPTTAQLRIIGLPLLIAGGTSPNLATFVHGAVEEQNAF